MKRVENRDTLFQEWRDYLAAVPPDFISSTDAALLPSTDEAPTKLTLAYEPRG